MIKYSSGSNEAETQKPTQKATECSAQSLLNPLPNPLLHSQGSFSRVPSALNNEEVLTPRNLSQPPTLYSPPTELNLCDMASPRVKSAS